MKAKFKSYLTLPNLATFALIVICAVFLPFDPVTSGALAVAGFGITGAPTLAQVAEYGVNRPGSGEVIGQSLYDWQIYPTAGATSFQFFALPLGQGLSASPGNAGNAKTLADTNMEAAGQLPAPKAQLVMSIEVYFEPGSVSTANTFTPQRPYSFAANAAVGAAGTPLSANAINDYSAVMEAGWVDLFIGSKSYLKEAKLARFPQKAGLEISTALASNSSGTAGALATSWAKSVGRVYVIDPPILLVPNQNFSLTINFPVAVATPSGFNGRIGVVMDGYLYRNAQ